MQHRFSLFLVLFAGFFGAFTPAQAQTEPVYPLKGKTVAVYFSKRQFSFDDNYRIPLSQFIRSDQGTETEIEDLKLQSLVAIAALFSAQLKAASQADSVYFLNEFPELARTFIGAYSSQERKMTPARDAFGQTDYVLVVNPFILGSYKTSAVYTRSNRIITEQVVVKTARIRFELYNPRDGLMMHIFEACMDERQTAVPEILFQFHIKSSKTGKFLGRLFSLVVSNMNAGLKTNCEVN